MNAVIVHWTPTGLVEIFPGGGEPAVMSFDVGATTSGAIDAWMKFAGYVRTAEWHPAGNRGHTAVFTKE